MSRSRVLRLDSMQQFAAINVLTDPGAIGGPVVIPNAVKIIIRWNLASGKVAHNVLGGIVAGGFTPTTAIAQSIYSGISSGSGWSALAPFLPTTVSIAGVDLLDIRVANQPLVSSTGAAVPGTSASPAMPSEVALTVTLRTARTGPAYRGRFYLAGFATNAIAAGDVVAPALMTATGTWLAGLNGALTGQSIQWALLQPARQAYTGVSGTQHPARPAGATILNNMLVRDNHWDTQRRRGLK